MSDAKLNPQEAAEVETRREDHRANQPYASEIDDRELEHAHKQHRPVDPKAESGKTGE